MGAAMDDVMTGGVWRVAKLTSIVSARIEIPVMCSS